MIRKYVLTALAIGGIVLAILTVISGNRQAPVAAPVVQPPKAPFESYVAGAGIVEASTRNIAIGRRKRRLTAGPSARRWTVRCSSATSSPASLPPSRPANPR